MNSFLLKFIKRNKTKKTLVMNGVGNNFFYLHCPQEINFFNNEIIPIIRNKSLLENKVALETVFRKELISIAKGNKIYKDCPKGTNYFLTEKDGLVIRHIVEVVNDVNAIELKDYIIKKSMEILSAEETKIRISLFSYFNSEKMTILIEKVNTLIRVQSEKENIELDLSLIINIDETERINTKLISNMTTEKELEYMALNTILRNCEKCIYQANCPLINIKGEVKF